MQRDDGGRVRRSLGEDVHGQVPAVDGDLAVPSCSTVPPVRSGSSARRTSDATQAVDP